MKKLEKNKAAILQLALDKNYWGKRLKDRRLECAELLIASLDLAKVEPLELANWLDANKPEKPAKAKRPSAKAKPAADTMTGSALREALEVADTAEIVIITAAQNNTAINALAWQAVQAASLELHAQIIVLPIHYNLNAFSPAVSDAKEYFDPAVKPFLYDGGDHWLFDVDAIRVAPSLRSIPTDKLPINGLAALNGGELFTVAPHTKQQLRTLPRLLDQPIRQALTTGCITGYNYTATRAGATAQADHAYGFLIAKRDQTGVVTVTAIRIASDGSYAFVLPSFTPDNEIPIWTAYGEPTQTGDRPAVVLGDLHCEVYDPATFDQTLAFLGQVDPCVVAIHDAIHFGTMSHHNRHDSIHLYRTKDQSVFDDLAEVIRQLNAIADFTDVLYMVESNHNAAVDRWIGDRSFDPSSSPHNAAIYHLISWLVCQEIDEGGTRQPWEIALQSGDLSGLPALTDKIVFGRMDQPFKVYGFDLSQHGHKGNNGSFGSHATLAAYSNSGLALVSGHTHSSAITGKCYTVGTTASLNQGYNRGGGSSWTNAHALVWPNGEAHLVSLNFQTV